MGSLYATCIKTTHLLSALATAFPQYSKERLFSFVLCGNVTVNEETVKDHTRVIKKESVIMLFDESIEPDESDKYMNEHGSSVAHGLLSALAHSQHKKKFVSRGAYKLDAVIDMLDISIEGTVWLDCGCATGGFTQCLLERNVRLVHAVDVAYNSLDYILRIDSRVIVHERTNVLALSSLDPMPQYAVADLSFRSLRGIARKMVYLCEEQCVLALCKPQFEYADMLKKNRAENTAEQDAFNGIITDSHIVRTVVQALCVDLLDEGVGVVGIYPAGIKGRQGNQEYFLVLVGVAYDKEQDMIHFNSGQISGQMRAEILGQMLGQMRGKISGQIKESMQKQAMLDSYRDMVQASVLG